MKSNVSLISRLGAIIYDFFLVFSLVFCTGLVVNLIIQDSTKNPFYFFLMLLLTYGYFALSWVKGRQTLGMKAWKFEIMQADRKSITYTQSLTRFVLAPLSLIGAGFIFQLFNKNRLPLHDYISRTYLQSTKK
ncbi:MAG TPA: RDD family protein [Candidatus Thioglobus sp.]|nr:RDD family protein [Candidatus Thioglobus sp.]